MSARSICFMYGQIVPSEIGRNSVVGLSRRIRWRMPTSVATRTVGARGLLGEPHHPVGGQDPVDVREGGRRTPASPGGRRPPPRGARRGPRSRSSGRIFAWTGQSPTHRCIAPAGDLADVLPEEHVREEEDLLAGRDRFDDPGGVRARADVVRLGLDVGRGVDVGDDGRARVLRFPLSELLDRDRVGERAAGLEVGQAAPSSYGFRIFAVSAMNRTPAKTMTGRSVSTALPGQVERVSDEVGDILDLRYLVVVREEDGVALLLQALHLGLERHRPSRRELGPRSA